MANLKCFFACTIVVLSGVVGCGGDYALYPAENFECDTEVVYEYIEVKVPVYIETEVEVESDPGVIWVDSFTQPQSVDGVDILWVIDTSGSMGGVSIEQAKASLTLALSQLRPQDSFNIIEFNSKMRVLFRAPMIVNRHTIQKAGEFVRQLQAGGGTEMLAALQAALSRDNSMPAESTLERVRQIVFITDGAIGNEEQLFEEIVSTVGDSRLFTVGIGSAPNSWFMRKAAQFGKGTHTHIGDISEVTEKMRILFDQISTPLATKLQVSWPSEVEAYPQRIPDLSIPGQAKGIVDLYDVTDDWIPIYDKSDLGGFYMAVGTSGNQYKNGSIAGLLMAELIDACEHGHDHDADPIKVECPKTGLLLDAGFYSRNREINENSSFSVLG